MDVRDIEFVVDAHKNHCKKGRPQIRIFDGKTPYHVHLLWCATAILQEPNLPIEIRNKGSLALLYHDILEDTTKELPNWLPKEVVECIKDMTFDSSEDEWKTLWSKNIEIRLFKLYDKTNNLLDSTWMKAERRKRHVGHLKKLIKDVEKNYGQLNIIKIAKSLI